jgi:hypothetical protein
VLASGSPERRAADPDHLSRPALPAESNDRGRGDPANPTCCPPWTSAKQSLNLLAFEIAYVRSVSIEFPGFRVAASAVSRLRPVAP